MANFNHDEFDVENEENSTKTSFKDWVMKNKAIAISAVAGVLCVIITLILILALGGKKVENIGVTKNNMPQSVYVVGSDLNLADGKLTVIIKGKETQIPLTDEGVTITGYDKDRLGEQILTITYEEKTTTIKVSVVPRMVAGQYETAYFIGETFNEDKGMLTITNDDGSDFSVAFSDEKVKISGFDSSAAVKGQKVTLTYADGTVSYDTTIDVAVYAVTSVDFKSPNKKDYKNHETALDLTGGYISVKCDELTRYEELTADMVSGFDLSAATLAHRETPLTQTITVTFLGQTKTYDIQITYSDVSLMGLRASEMKNLKFTDETVPTALTEEMGENALEAMKAYYKMSDADKNLLADGDIDFVAKTAAIYGLDKWRKAFASYSDAFYLQDNRLFWNCEDVEKTAAAHTKLAQRDPIIYEDGKLLVDMKADFAALVVYGETTAADMLSVVYDTETMDIFEKQLNLMLSLHEALKDVPDTWTLEELNAEYADEIHNAWVILRETEYTHLTYRNIYSLASRWRTNDDYFEILYAYYYAKGDYTSINAFKDMHLPGALEELYTNLYNAKTQIQYIQGGMQYGTTDFMFFYDQAKQVRDEVLASDDVMLKDLYEKLTFDYLVSDGNGNYAQYSFDQLFELFRRTSYGELYQMSAYLGVEEFEGLWSTYLAVLDDMMDDEDYIGSAKHAAAAEQLLRDYIALSPLQQFVYMYSVNPYYKPSVAGRLPEMFWDNSEMIYSSFVDIIYNYYDGVLSKEAFDIFVELMLAVEETANSLTKSTSKEDLIYRMGNVKDMLETLSESDKTAYDTFNTNFGWLLEKYNGYVTKFEDIDPKTNKPKTENLGDWQDEFEALLYACRDAYFIGEVNPMLTGGPSAAAYIAAMAKVEILAEQILASNDPTILTAYYFDEFVILNGITLPGASAQNFGGTLDFLMFYLGEKYAAMMTGSAFESTLLWDAIHEMDMADFFMESSYLTYNQMYRSTVGGGENDKFFTDSEQVVKIMTDFRKLTIEQQYFYLVLDRYRSYHFGVGGFAAEVINAETSIVVDTLMLVEYLYVFTNGATDEEDAASYREMLEESFATLVSEYEDMSKDSESLQKFNQYFAETYSYYMEKCEAMGITANK